MSAFRFSVRQILIALVLISISRPFLVTAWGQLVENILFSFLLISSLMAVGSGKKELVISLILILPAISSRWLTQLFALQPNDVFPVICVTLALGLVIWQMLRFVIRTRKVDGDTLCAGISVYLLLANIWSFFYLLTERFVPASFRFPGLPGHGTQLTPDEASYFSFCTITTAGYGDIIPTSPHARSLATLESTAGVLYMAILIGRLVALHLANQRAALQLKEDLNALNGPMRGRGR